MAYYFRVFCTDDKVPALSDVLEWAQGRGVTLNVDMSGGCVEEWGTKPVALRYADDQPPFLAELNYNEGPDSVAAQEIGEFIGILEEVKKTPRKRNQVIDHLRKTKFIIACELPLDFADEGFHALDVFMAYFLVHSNGMVQADGQGFYDMGRLVVEAA